MLVRDWPAAAKKLSDWGYATSPELIDKSIEAARKFLRDWIKRTKSVYCAVSLPPEFRYGGPDDKSDTAVVLRQVVMPVLRRGRSAVRDDDRLDQAARIPNCSSPATWSACRDVASLARICLEFPNNQFLVTMLARENQQELCVLARKFGNLMIFGCWWWLNNPSLVEEITRMRVELLGTTLHPAALRRPRARAAGLQVGPQPVDHRQGARRQVRRPGRRRLGRERSGNPPRREANARRPRPDDDRTAQRQRITAR